MTVAPTLLFSSFSVFTQEGVKRLELSIGSGLKQWDIIEGTSQLFNMCLRSFNRLSGAIKTEPALFFYGEPFLPTMRK